MKNTLLAIACTLLMGNILSEAGETGETAGHVPVGVVFHTETLHRSNGWGSRLQRVHERSTLKRELQQEAMER